ncbi:MAG: menaquinone biosynthesis protein, partial [Acidobacteria bacterium]|nr:menaquinone biosynthesis protein [Acidobacteriota bacterium]
MERLRVSVVRYLNTAPLVWGFQHGPQRDQVELSFTVPSACAEAIRTGAADVGIIPSIAYQTIPNLKLIPGIALGARGAVESVLLVSHVPAAEVRSVAVDTGSRTSAALVRILFAQKWKKQPQFRQQEPNLETMLTQNDAALVIGDPALQFSLNSVNVPGAAEVGKLFVYDLGAEWRRLTGQPFVFAVWAVRAEKANSEVAQLFTASKEYGLAHVEQIAAEAAERLYVPAAGLAHYLRQNMHYSLDDE